MAGLLRVIGSGLSKAPARPLRDHRRVWAVACVSLAGLFIASSVVSANLYGYAAPVAIVVAGVQVGGIGLAVVRPWMGLLLGLVALTLVSIASVFASNLTPLPATERVALILLLFVLGIVDSWVLPAVGWAATIVIVSSAAVIADPVVLGAGNWDASLISGMANATLAGIAGVGIGQRRRNQAQLLEARRQVERGDSQRRWLEERRRIAREMHDVVAHSMSLVHMRATSAPYRIDDPLPERVAQEFTAIAEQAREALREMRGLLGVLRDDEVPLRPQPTLKDVGELINNARRAGLNVHPDVQVPERRLSANLELAVYRVAQEALSNVVKHAPGARTALTLRQEDEALVLTVTNRLSGDASGGNSRSDAGYGLRGMGERVAIHGGQLEARVQEEEWFVVRARFPLAGDGEEQEWR